MLKASMQQVETSPLVSVMSTGATQKMSQKIKTQH